MSHDRKVRVFIKNPAYEKIQSHIFSSELVLQEGEESMDLSLIQVSLPPVGLSFKIFFNIFPTGAPPSYPYGIIVTIPVDNYASVSDLATAINTALGSIPVLGYGNANYYVSPGHSGGYLEFSPTSTIYVVPSYIQVSDTTTATLLGIPVGDLVFVTPKTVAPNKADFGHPPPAVYIHTDLNTTWRNIDNIDTPEFTKGNIFAKIPITTYTGISNFYDSTPAFHLNIETGTLAGINMYLTDINKSPITPLQDWGMVLEVNFKKRELHQDVHTNLLLKQAVDYLKLMWLSNPPTSIRKTLKQEQEQEQQ